MKKKQEKCNETRDGLKLENEGERTIFDMKKYKNFVAETCIQIPENGKLITLETKVKLSQKNQATNEL